MIVAVAVVRARPVARAPTAGSICEIGQISRASGGLTTRKAGMDVIRRKQAEQDRLGYQARGCPAPREHDKDIYVRRDGWWNGDGRAEGRTD